ncbi:CHAD domain-containing protein [Geofilum rubicundum]|uniref:CHAD domain-containing protein n=1 Tax=Geofilum rubicundum JCM 15548 TaxID=1236989 RepID=A0A0E9LRQ9_9BACT|nr:CHAD domain-containing protein [Geofilum rubicundum]GAO27963.1 hypothetical protein JCM15548_12 [Geofilum rubicundum JCM 15548]
MRRDQILQVAKEQYQLFLEHFKWSLVSDEAEYIHQFRVSVKKLSALKLLVSDPLIWDFIQPVYKTGGKVRNVQVILDLLSTFTTPAPEGFKQYLYDRLQEKRFKHDQLAGTIKLLSDKQFFAAFKAFLEEHYDGDGKHLETVILWHGRRACEWIRKNKAGEAWHEARRYFKACAHLIQMADAVGEPLTLDEGFFRYREMEQLLGLWHDLFVLNKWMDKYALQAGSKRNDLWSSFISEKTETMLRTEADICLLANDFNMP